MRRGGATHPRLRRLARVSKAVPAALRDRIIAQASAGAGPAALLQPLIDAGWLRDDAVAAVDALLAEHLAGLARERALPEPKRVPAPVGLNGPSVIPLPDRSVRVLANLLQPRVVVFGELLAPEECVALIDTARERLVRSRVVSETDPDGEVHAARTSEGTYFLRGATPLIARIEARIAALMEWPVEFGEGLQILRYGPGAEYQPHYDYFAPSEPASARQLAHGGQRVASLILYLNTPVRGGATVFPDVRFEVSAIAGNAAFFSYEIPHPVSKTLHGGAPVLEGEKWIATKWLREGVCP
ncbi:MAG: 2OG-Fe(II) oxygenase [Steroidobacteraceae bacterium]